MFTNFFLDLNFIPLNKLIEHIFNPLIVRKVFNKTINKSFFDFILTAGFLPTFTII